MPEPAREDLHLLRKALLLLEQAARNAAIVIDRVSPPGPDLRSVPAEGDVDQH